MARARTGGAGSGYAWALVIFGAGFVICLLLAIVFFAQLGGARQEAREAEGRLQQFVTPADMARPEFEPFKTQPGGVVGQLAEQNRQLRQLVAGSADVPLDEIDRQRSELEVDNLLRTIRDLRAEVVDTERRLQEAERARQQQASRADEAVQAREDLAQRYTQSVQALEAQIAQLRQDLQDNQGRTAGLEERLRREFDTARRGLTQRGSELESQLAAANNEVERLRRIITDLSPPQDGAPLVAQADAVVTGLLPGQYQVYINRGARDRIVLGMTFEVFSQGDLVRLEDTGGDLRGKATVEIIDVRDNASLARVVRVQRGQSLSQGDQLVNIVYDPQATNKFFVYGDFDIDNTGDPQVSDRRRIEDRITRWGGTLTSELSYDVDYLVLGQEPPLPEPLPPGVIDPVRIAQNVEAQRNYQTYQQLVGEARDMNIPILNQNRFLNLTGFYRR